MKTSDFYIFVILIGFMGLIYMHEQVHVAIYGNYGIESHVEYIEYFPSVATVSEERCPTELCSFAHDLNEIIGYTLQVLYGVVAVCFWISRKEMEE